MLTMNALAIKKIENHPDNRAWNTSYIETKRKIEHPLREMSKRPPPNGTERTLWQRFFEAQKQDIASRRWDSRSLPDRYGCSKQEHGAKLVNSQ